MSEDWYYFQNGNQVGPVSDSVLRELLQTGRLRWDDLVWHDGLPDWLAAEQIPNLASLRVVPIPAPAPAPAPPPFTPPAPPAPPAAAPVPVFAAPIPEIPAQPLSAIRPVSPSAPAAPMFADVSEATVAILAKTRPWVRLIGIMVFISCVLMVLGGIAGLVAGILSSGGGLAGVGIGAAALAAYIIAAAFIVPMGLFLNRYAKGIRVVQTSRRSEDLERALLAQKSYWKYVGIFTLVGIALSILGVVGMVLFGLSTYLGSSY